MQLEPCSPVSASLCVTRPLRKGTSSGFIFHIFSLVLRRTLTRFWGDLCSAYFPWSHFHNTPQPHVGFPSVSQWIFFFFAFPPLLWLPTLPGLCPLSGQVQGLPSLLWEYPVLPQNVLQSLPSRQGTCSDGRSPRGSLEPFAVVDICLVLYRKYFSTNFLSEEVADIQH